MQLLCKKLKKVKMSAASREGTPLSLEGEGKRRRCLLKRAILFELCRASVLLLLLRPTQANSAPPPSVFLIVRFISGLCRHYKRRVSIDWAKLATGVAQLCFLWLSKI